MTAEELARQLYERQGYLLIATTRPHKIGEITDTVLHDFTEPRNQNVTPLRVVAESSQVEMAVQGRLIGELVGVPYKGPRQGWKYYYRVEAAD